MGRPRKGWKLRDPRHAGAPYTVRFTNKAGRPVELSTGTTDPREASGVAAQLYARDQLSAGALVRTRIDPLLALDELFALCLADLAKALDAETVAEYVRYARVYVTFFDSSLVNVNRARMADYQRDRLTKVLRSTVRKERSFLNTFLGWAVEQNVLAEEDRPEWPKLSRKATGVRSGPQRAVPVDVTREQVGAFLGALPLWSKPRLGRRHAVRPRFIVAYETGLRPATLDGLELGKHWALGNGYIDISEDIDKARYGRRVPITRLAQAALTFVAATLGLVPGDLLFGSHDYREQVERARVAADLPAGFAVYDLRHGRVGHLLDETGDVRATMFLVGHLQMTTTNRYVRGQETGARAALTTMSSGDIPGMNEDAMLVRRKGLEPLQELPHRNLNPVLGSQNTANTESATGQEVSESDLLGQVSGDTPETQIPNSATAAARYLEFLQASDEAFAAMVTNGAEFES